MVNSSYHRSTKLITCYNKGCGKQFDLSDNKEDACQFHPGVPVFHDALKGWSCCNKKSTDFSQFLSFPGCTRAAHSNVKPVEPEKPKKENIPDLKEQEVLIYETRKAPEMTPRPTQDEPLVELNRTIAPSLKTALEKLTEVKQTNEVTETNDQIPVDTPCKNAACQARYRDEKSNLEKCTYHSGVAVFHEGMKYWSCCQRKTSDFDSFLNQAGCTEGQHLWSKKESNIEGEIVECRYDFHQTGGYAILTVYSKNPLPQKTTVKASQVKLELHVVFENGAKSFVKNFELFGVIKLEESVVNFYQSKVEIKMKKADAISWAKLEFIPKKN
ncbi:unnamed protein product [Brachionus calyciflorus]|uniref:Cysteine and histidine-rich domain-containing protein 1 n=1 Tax=Brachionus calyciflorus TaxID=104777 RepID=A0A814DD95_9BILA|nr:unnamed protein product [Brachionus calyciflorus]